MEEFIAELMPYADLQEKVLNNEKAVSKATSVVVPDTNANTKGSAGLVYMYNESSGLRLDDNKRLCIAAANDTDIKTAANDKTKASVNKPIVPYYMQAALQAFLPKVTNTNMDIGGAEEMLPPATYAVREYVAKKAGFNVRSTRIASGASAWNIPASTFAMISPYSAKFTGDNWDDPNNVQPVSIEFNSIAFMMVTGPVDQEGNPSLNGKFCRCMFISVNTAMGIPNITSAHHLYKLDTCKLTNTSNGNLWIYYTDNEVEK